MSSNVYRHMSTRALQRAYRRELRRKEANLDMNRTKLADLHDEAARTMAEELDQRPSSTPRGDTITVQAWEEKR